MLDLRPTVIIGTLGICYYFMDLPKSVSNCTTRGSTQTGKYANLGLFSNEISFKGGGNPVSTIKTLLIEIFK